MNLHPQHSRPPSLPHMGNCRICEQGYDLASRLSMSEDERAAAVAALAELRRDLADRQLALSAAQDAAAEASERAATLNSQLNDSQQMLLEAQSSVAELQLQLQASEVMIAQLEQQAAELQQQLEVPHDLAQQQAAAVTAEDGAHKDMQVGREGVP